MREEGAKETENRQRVRSSKEIEAIFGQADLHIYHSTMETIVHEDFGPMRIWLLSKNVTANATILEDAPGTEHGEGEEVKNSNQIVKEQAKTEGDSWDMNSE